MAFESRGPVMLALPPFRGVTRQIVLIAGALCLLRLVLGIVYAPLATGVLMHLILTPHMALLGQPWQFVTYAFLADGLLNTAFALLSLWFFGSALEDVRGGRWLTEYVAAAAVGGGVLAAAIAYMHIPGVGPFDSAFGLWPVVLALLLAFARMNPDAEMRLYFVLTVKAKHVLMIFLFFYLVGALVSNDRFSAMTALCVALCGYLYLRFAPRKGLRFAVSEGWYGTRNAFYRARRRRAAKAFTVYMKEQGKDVSLDTSERYLDSRDPKSRNDTRWMN